MSQSETFVAFDLISEMSASQWPASAGIVTAFVAEVGADKHYKLYRSSVEAANGYTVLSACGGGRWLLVEADALPNVVIARGQVDVNVPDLTAFALSGGGRDGIAYLPRNLVVLNKQTTVAQNGLYLVGATPDNTHAPLTRPKQMRAGSALVSGMRVLLSQEGAEYGGLVLQVRAVSGVVDTDDPLLRFESVRAEVTAQVGPVYAAGKGFSGNPTRNAQGDYTMTFGAGFDGSHAIVRGVTPKNGGGGKQTVDVVSLIAGAVRIETFTDGVLSDWPFYIECASL